MKDILAGRAFDSRIRSERMTRREMLLGHFFGPASVVLLNAILSGYLNVYYTDVVGLGRIWNGWFLSMFPVVVKLLDAATFLMMGKLIDRCHFRQGAARPWILLSAPLITVSMVLLFAFPDGGDRVTIAWIFFSYNLFYSVAYTAYNTAQGMMLPLSTRDMQERNRLSMLGNVQPMLAGLIVAVLFPTFLLPAIGVDRGRWTALMSGFACLAVPCLLLEYYFTRERVTEETGRTRTAGNALPLRRQLKMCLKSRLWTMAMIYITISSLTGSLSGASTFYYCNWVLGSYNDGFTQLIFYAVGNAPLGLGILLCGPLSRRFGRTNAMAGGLILSALGALICMINPHSLPLVVAGQVIKAMGQVPSAYLFGAHMADALDDVERACSRRMDSFSSAACNTVSTLTVGLATCILNMGMTQLGYLAPGTEGAIMAQNGAVCSFFTLCTLGIQIVAAPLMAAVLKAGDRKNGKKLIV